MAFFIGGPVDDDSERNPDAQTIYDPSDLTTHGVIVGITGSGEIAKLRERYTTRLRKLEHAHADALRAAESAEAEVNDARWSDRLTMAGSVVDPLSDRKLRIPKTSTRSAKGRLRKAGDKAEQRSQDIDELNADFDDEVVRIRQECDTAAESVEDVEIGLEAEDIRIADTRVLWIRK